MSGCRCFFFSRHFFFRRQRNQHVGDLYRFPTVAVAPSPVGLTRFRLLSRDMNRLLFPSCWGCLVFFVVSLFSYRHTLFKLTQQTSIGERERKKAAKIQPLVAKISGKESKKATRRDNLDQTRYTTGLAGCPDTTVWLSDRWRALSLTSTVGFARLMLPHTCWHILAIEYYQRLTCRKSTSESFNVTLRVHDMITTYA